MNFTLQLFNTCTVMCSFLIVFSRFTCFYQLFSCVSLSVGFPDFLNDNHLLSVRSKCHFAHNDNSNQRQTLHPAIKQSLTQFLYPIFRRILTPVSTMRDLKPSQEREFEHPTKMTRPPNLRSLIHDRTNSQEQKREKVNSGDLFDEENSDMHWR